MKKVNLIFRTITWCVVIIFTTTTIVWSAPSGVQARGEGEEKALPAGRQGIVQAMAEQYQKDQKIHDASSTIPDENVKNTPSKQITSKPPRGAALYKAPLVWRLSLPENYGTIKIRWIGGKSPGGTHTQQGAVAIIQDAHCNYEAQMNIAKIIHHMSTNVQKDISVGLEGATGAIDTSIFRNYPDHDIRDAVSRYFVREGKITGAEYASITSDGTVPYFGVEDEKLYLDNYKAFLSIVKCRGPLTEEVEAIEGILSQLRTLLYSPELKEFEKAYFNFREENLTFFEYADILLHQAKECAIDLFEYPNISLFREVKEREGRINFEKLSEEINAYLAVLCGRLQSAGGANEELGRIDRFTKQYNEGAIPNHDYFNYLVEQGFKHKVNLLAYTNLYEYSQYLKTYKRIDKQALRFERRALEKSIKTYLAQTTTTNNTSTIQELLRLSERLHFVQSLIEVKIFNQDIEQFENERYSFRAKEYVDFVIRTAPKHNIPYNLSLNIAYLDRIIPKVYDFYAASMKRDEVMVENLLEKSAPLTLLIAGGFHTAGLCKQLEERGISYIVIAPRITQKQSDQDEIYLSRMLGEPDAFDVMMMELLKMPERQSLTVSGMPVNTSFFAESFMQMLQRMLKYFDAGGQSLHDPTVPENPSLKLMRIYFNNEFDMLSHTLYDLYGREYDMDATLDPAHKLYRDEIDFKHLTSSEEVAGDVVDIQLPAISEISGTTVLQDIVKTLVTLQRGMSITLRIQQEGSTQSMLVEVSVRETQEEETTVRDDTSPVYDALSVSDERGLDAARDTFFVKYENDDAEIKGIISSIEDDIEKVKSAGIAYTEKQTQKADVTKEMESLMSRVNSATARIEEIIEQTKDVEEPSNMAAHVRQMRYVEIRGSLREFSTVLTALEMTALEEEKFHVYLNKHQEIKEKLVNFIFQHNAARKQFLEENQSFVYMRRNDEPFRDGYHKRIAEEIAVKVLSGNYYGDLSSDSPIGSIHKDIVDMGKYIQRAYEIDAAKERMPEGAALLVEGSNIAAQKVFSGVDIARAVDAQEAAPVEAAQLYERSELDEGLRKARGMIFQQAIDKAESPDHAVFVGPARSVKAKKRITIDGSEEVASSKVGDLVHYTEEELRAALNAAHQMAQQRSPAPAHAGAQIKGGVIGGLTIGVARFIARTANIVSLGRIVDNKVLRDNLEAVLSAPIVETGLFVAATQNAFTAAGLSTGATLFGGIGTGIVFALAHIFNSRDMIKDGWNAAFSLDAGTRAEARGRIAEESKSKDIDWPAVGLVAIVNVIGIMTGVWGVVGAGFFHIAVNSYRERQQKAGAQIAAEQIVDVEAEVIKDAELISFEEERLQRAEQVRKLSKSIEERALDDAEENIEAEIVSIHTQLTNLKKTLETLNELRLSDQTAMKK